MYCCGRAMIGEAATREEGRCNFSDLVDEIVIELREHPASYAQHVGEDSQDLLHDILKELYAPKQTGESWEDYVTRRLSEAVGVCEAAFERLARKMVEKEIENA